MADLNIGRGRMMAEHLAARQTTSSRKSTTTFVQPTSVIALTTTFTPPSSCFENILTMLPPPGYMIWANEPVPVENQSVVNCYPSEFMKEYTSVSSGKVGSSIVPAMSPFVCPRNYCTMFAEEKNYIACCPSGYQFHPPDTLVDTERPAYGGTCYSDFAVQTDYPVVAYNESGNTASQVFSASASGAQAYAHPIDGFALTSPSMIGCPVSSPSPSPSSSSSSSSSGSQASSPLAASATAATDANSGKGMSSGAIAGASIGGILGLAAIIGFLWFALVYRKRNRNASNKVHHIGDDFADQKGAIVYAHHEADGGYTGAEIGTSGRPLRDEKGNPYKRHSELNDGYGAFEMPGDPPAELDSGATAKDGKIRISKLLDKTDKERISRMANWKDTN